MSNTIISSTPKKSAYQRPYKSRTQRREIDRRKYEETKERQFLKRSALAVGLLVIIALSFFIKGWLGHENAPARPMPSVEVSQ